MKRIMEPLSMMGAKIRSIHCNDCAPLAINFMTILCEQFLIQYPVTVFHFFGIMFFGMFQILFTKLIGFQSENALEPGRKYFRER